jgi:hypothetical protein
MLIHFTDLYRNKKFINKWKIFITKRENQTILKWSIKSDHTVVIRIIRSHSGDPENHTILWWSRKSDHAMVIHKIRPHSGDPENKRSRKSDHTLVIQIIRSYYDDQENTPHSGDPGNQITLWWSRKSDHTLHGDLENHTTLVTGDPENQTTLCWSRKSAILHFETLPSTCINEKYKNSNSTNISVECPEDLKIRPIV